MLNSNQGLALFRQTQTLNGHKNLHKHNSNVFQIFDECLVAFYENNKKFLLTKEILNQPIF